MSTSHSRSHRLLTLLTEPNSKIEDKTLRQLAIVLYSFQLAMIPIAVLTILTGDLVSNVEFILLGAVIGILTVYLISRILAYKQSVIFVVSLYTLVPMLIWFSVTNWQPHDIPRIMPYIIVAFVLGALFTDERIVVLQWLAISFLIIYTVGIFLGIPLTEYDNHLLTVSLLALMAIIFSRMINSYLTEINRQSSELKKQNRDLEIYTRLLRHDLSNDLQAIINTVELSQLLLPINEESVHENLEQSMNFGLRMQKLLHLFRLPTEQPSANLVEDIRRIASESEAAHKNLDIEVLFSDEAERSAITASRLLPLVWTNIFRNASQHAGEHPRVSVNISIVERTYLITIRDNGPGIPHEKRVNLFKKSAYLDQRDKGVGLYLSKLIIESHGGSIELADIPETKFIIKIPVNLSH
ncbi:MAG: sensor histidine kinase [Candidatus Thorarchaeota archaeon]